MQMLSTVQFVSFLMEFRSHDGCEADSSEEGALMHLCDLHP